MIKQAPYPADTKAKGWRFELDHERIRQSDTWALATPELRPWLLMLWMVAWEQVPCGSLPADDALIAARLGMSPKAFAKAKPILLRGWWQADDGRLYHQTLTERVLDMISYKDKERARKSAYRDRKSNDVPRDSRVTDAGKTVESSGRDDTGTGTGTGTGTSSESSGIPPTPSAGDAGGGVEITPGIVCKALKLAGIGRANPSNQRLISLVNAGATISEFRSFAEKAKDKGDPFAWLLVAMEKERERAAQTAATMHQGPMPVNGSGPPGETFRERDRRLAAEEAAKWSPRIADRSLLVEQPRTIFPEGVANVLAIGNR